MSNTLLRALGQAIHMSNGLVRAAWQALHMPYGPDYSCGGRPYTYPKSYGTGHCTCPMSWLELWGRHCTCQKDLVRAVSVSHRHVQGPGYICGTCPIHAQCPRYSCRVSLHMSNVLVSAVGVSCAQILRVQSPG